MEHFTKRWCKAENVPVCMYKVVKAKVRSGSDFTDSSMCPRGLKHGDICSPILFSMFTDELATEIMEHGS